MLRYCRPPELALPPNPRLMVMNVLTTGLLPRTLRHTASTPMGTLGTGQESAILFETARTELHLMFQNRSLLLRLQTSRDQRIRKWDWVTTTILLGVKGQHKSKKERLRLVAAALAAVAQEGCFDTSFGYACWAIELFLSTRIIDHQSTSEDYNLPASCNLSF